MSNSDQVSQAKALHNAARHYCVERGHRWKIAYSTLSEIVADAISAADGTWDYTNDARRIFPRYNVLDAILNAVEQIVPESADSVDSVRSQLAAAATAVSVMTKTDHPIDIVVIEEERRLFADFVRTCDPETSMSLPELPFKRTLNESDARALTAAFEARWGDWYGGGVDRENIPQYLTVHVLAMDTPGAYDKLREALAELGPSRIFELREPGSCFEVDIPDTDFLYTGEEGWWTPKSLEWMVYASHESSITFGGPPLIEKMRAKLSGLDRWLYRGWDLREYGSE